MRKAVLKRVKITKTGKVLRRHSGQNHFNAKASRRFQLKKKGYRGFYKTAGEKIKKYL